jgi:hypothetical protein
MKKESWGRGYETSGSKYWKKNGVAHGSEQLEIVVHSAYYDDDDDVLKYNGLSFDKRSRLLV